MKGNAPRPETIGVSDGIIQYILIFPGPQPEESKPVQGVMLVEMINEGSIRAEVFRGNSSASAFTTAAKVYER